MHKKTKDNNRYKKTKKENLKEERNRTPSMNLSFFLWP